MSRIEEYVTFGLELMPRVLQVLVSCFLVVSSLGGRCSGLEVMYSFLLLSFALFSEGACLLSLLRGGFSLRWSGLVLFVRSGCCTTFDVTSAAGGSGMGMAVSAQSACLVMEAPREQSR